MDLCSWIILGLLGTVLWPLNVPLMALAFKVHVGHRSVPWPLGEFWLRAAGASFLLAVLGVITGATLAAHLHLRQDAIGGDIAILATGILFVGLLLAHGPVGIWLMFRLFELEEVFEGTSVYLIYVFIPGLPLVLLNLAFGLRAMILERLAA